MRPSKDGGWEAASAFFSSLPLFGGPKSRPDGILIEKTIKQDWEKGKLVELPNQKQAAQYFKVSSSGNFLFFYFFSFRKD